MKRDSSPALRVSSVIVAVAAMTLFSAAGCGAAATSPGAGDAKAISPMQPEPAPQNMAEAEALFARAENDLQLAFGPEKQVAGQFAQPPMERRDQPGGGPTSPAPPPQRTAKDGDERPEAVATGQATAGAMSDSAAAPIPNPCAMACRALGSMGRSAMHICSLAGSSDERCANAQERVRMATDRVRQSCGACDS